MSAMDPGYALLLPIFNPLGSTDIRFEFIQMLLSAMVVLIFASISTGPTGLMKYYICCVTLLRKVLKQDVVFSRHSHLLLIVSFFLPWTQKTIRGIV